MTPRWPDELPAPLKSVSVRPVSPIVRSKMVSGRTFVRRNFTAVPVVYRMTWLFNSEQAVIFENFFKDDLEDGTRWFEMRLRVAQGDGPWLFRFEDIYEGGDMVGAPSCPLWQYSASLEMFLRPGEPAPSIEEPIT